MFSIWDMWDVSQFPLMILFVLVLLLIVFSMVVTRRTQARTIMLLETNTKISETQMKLIERQTAAIERIASVLEAKQPPQSN